MFKCKKCGKKIGGDKKVYDIYLKDGIIVKKNYKHFKRAIKKYNVLEDEIELTDRAVFKKDVTLNGHPDIEIFDGDIIIKEVKPVIEKEDNKVVYRCPHCDTVLMTVVK